MNQHKDQIGTPCKVKPRMNPSSYASSGILRVLVGPDEKAFNVHKELLLSQSPYCAARTTYDGLEDTITIKLADVKVNHFEMIFNWLYSGRFSPSMEDMDDPDCKFNWQDWIELYHYADMLMMTNLQNAMVDADLDHNKDLGKRRRPWTFRFAYHFFDHEITHTPYYRMFMADSTYCYFGGRTSRESFERALKALADYPEALVDVLDHLDRYRREEWLCPTEGDRCRWHIHENNERCP